MAATAQPAEAIGYAANAAEAEEVAQETFLHCMRKLPQLRDDARIAGWLRRKSDK